MILNHVTQHKIDVTLVLFPGSTMLRLTYTLCKGGHPKLGNVYGTA